MEPPTRKATETLGTAADVTPGQVASSAMRWRIPGDLVARAMHEQPEQIRGPIKWFAGYCRSRNIDPAEAGALLTKPGSSQPYSGDSIYQAMTGRRDTGSLRNMARAIEDFRKRVEETSPRGRGFFVETSLTRKVWSACRYALTHQRITFVYGPSQIGKTAALDAYATAHNHGETIMVRMPTRGVMCDFVDDLCFACGISRAANRRDVRRRIFDMFDERTLLIVDEAEECLRSSYSDRALATLDFIREIHDRRKCGVVLAGADVLKHGIHQHKLLTRLMKRGAAGRAVQLPAFPDAVDMAEFAKRYSLSPAPTRKRSVEWTEIDERGERHERTIVAAPEEVQERVLRAFGLGRWLTILDEAQDDAQEAGGRITWDHVLVAHERSKDFEPGTGAKH